VEEDAQSRLRNGLATKPDVLEATSARAQADYDPQATVGEEEIARGELATVLSLPPQTTFEVQDVGDLPILAQWQTLPTMRSIAPLCSVQS
jgi:outer membrane protein